MDRYLPPLSPTAARWVRLAGLLATLVLLGWAVLDLRPVLTPILVALSVAYVCNPLVSLIERRGVPRLYAIIGLYVVGTCLLLILGVFLTVKTIEQFIELRANIGEYVQATRAWFAARAEPAASAPAVDWWREFGPLIQEHGVAVANRALGFLTGLFASVLNWLTIFVLIPLYTFVFLWKFNDILRAIRDHLPARSRDGTLHLATIIDRAIASFFRGRLIICLVVGLVTAVGWTLVGVPYSVPLGVLTGVLSLVPFLSLLVLPPALVSSYFGAVQADADWKVPVLLTMGVFLLVQALESFVVAPYVLAKSSGLHPLSTVVVLMIGAHWGGLAGLLLAIPVASTLKVLTSEFVLPELRRLAAQPLTRGARVEERPRQTMERARDEATE
jgi:predicted PurR-regulated permease PerM